MQIKLNTCKAEQKPTKRQEDIAAFVKLFVCVLRAASTSFFYTHTYYVFIDVKSYRVYFVATIEKKKNMFEDSLCHFIAFVVCEISCSL